MFDFMKRVKCLKAELSQEIYFWHSDIVKKFLWVTEVYLISGSLRPCSIHMDDQYLFKIFIQLPVWVLLRKHIKRLWLEFSGNKFKPNFSPVALKNISTHGPSELPYFDPLNCVLIQKPKEMIFWFISDTCAFLERQILIKQRVWLVTYVYI